ncbi:MAG: hypothetical protein IH946_07220 [Bacteroidetes bacterium]|nr:hypothetical protein [Bacteroidota bacterium]
MSTRSFILALYLIAWIHPHDLFATEELFRLDESKITEQLGPLDILEGELEVSAFFTAFTPARDTTKYILKHPPFVVGCAAGLAGGCTGSLGLSFYLGSIAYCIGPAVVYYIYKETEDKDKTVKAFMGCCLGTTIGITPIAFLYYYLLVLY